MLVQFNFGKTISGWNNATSNGLGVLISDLDDDGGSATGILLRSNLSSSFSDTAGRATSAHHGLPEEFWNGIAFGSGSNILLELQGLTPYIGQDYEIKLAGFSKSGSVREMDFDIDSGTSQHYISTTTEPPNAPVVFNGTIGTDTLDINSILDVGLSICNGFTIDIGAASPTVTQSDTTPEDGVQQSFTTTGLSGSITAATLGGKDILSLLSNTDPTTATTYTLDISAIEASQGAPRIGETSTLSITATGGTATTDVVIQPKTGWLIQTLAATLLKGTSGEGQKDFLLSLDDDLGITSAIGNGLYMSTARGEAITPQGLYTGGTTVAFQSTDFVIQQGGSATTVSTSEGGAFFPFLEGPVDTTIPVITVIGGDLNVLKDSTYNDAGATALDDIDGDITGDIVTTGSVNTAIVAVYVISYNVQDSSANEAVEKTRTVTVVDASTVPTSVKTNFITLADYLRDTLGYTGSTDDVIYEWLKVETGMTSATIEMWQVYLKTQVGGTLLSFPDNYQKWKDV